MRSTHFMFVAMSCGAVTAPVACSSNGGTEPVTSTGGSTNTLYSAGATGGSPVNVAVGGGGAGGAGVQLPAAQDTPDGLYAVSADVATAVQGATSVCTGGQSTPQGGGAVLEYLIDVSGSMSSDHTIPTDNNSPTKWAVFSQTLPSIFQNMASNYAVGAAYFSSTNNQCYQPNRADVPIAMNTATQLQALVNSVGAVQVNGSTPTYQGWSHAVDTVAAWQPGANDPPSMATAKRFVVLLTDGVPTVGQAPNNCTTNASYISSTEYDAELNLMQQKTASTGVGTFVVGVVGSNNPQGASFDPLYYLSQIAVIGGTAQPPGCQPVTGTPAITGTQTGTPKTNDVNPRGTYCHYDLSTSTDLGASLATTLSQIASSVLTCTYAVPRPPNTDQSIDPSQTVLIYTDGSTGQSSIVLQNTSATCDKGWHFTDGTNSQIEICGSTCAAIQGNSSSSMNVIFGCNTTKIIY